MKKKTNQINVNSCGQNNMNLENQGFKMIKEPRHNFVSNVMGDKIENIDFIIA